MRMLGWNIRTPFPRLNEIIRGGFSANAATFGPQYAEEYSLGLWNHEDTAGNLIPLAVLGLCLAVFGVLVVRGKRGLPVAYSVTCLAGFALVPLVISNGASLDGVRFQTPFFVSCAPVVGLLASRTIGARAAPLVGLSLIFAGLPWLLFNNTRPLLGRLPWTTRTPSVLEALLQRPALRDESRRDG